MTAASRLAELKLRIKKSAGALAAYERVESELRSLPSPDDPVRFRALMRANADILNATRYNLGVARSELAELEG